MIAVLALALLLQAPSQDAEFAEILKGFEADEAPIREAASRKLDALVDRLGPAAPDFLKAEMAGAKGEAKGRLQDKLTELLRIEKLRTTLAFFDVFEMPSVKDKRLVVFNPGQQEWSPDPHNAHRAYELGWLLSETADEVTLLDRQLQSVTLKKERASLKAWEKVRDRQPKDFPPPGELRDVDLSRMCADLMDATRTDAANGVGFFHRASNAWTLEPAKFAYWCLQRGQVKTAVELLELGESAWRAEARGETRPYAEFLVERACAALRTQAIDAPKLERVDLLKKWRAIEKLFPQFRGGEAKEMTALYERMLEEDKAWKEPSPQERAKLEPAARVNYWIYHLRDVAARQWSDPGSCQVLSPFHQPKDGTPYPPNELVKLGWDAIPGLIEHLDDRRPSRSVGWHRSFNPDSYYLLRVGDCCEQIFREITGVAIYQRKSTSGAMVKDGDAAAAKDAALRWWAEQKDGAEKYYLGALQKPELASTAAAKLLAMDKAKHLPRLLSIIEKGPSASRKEILAPLAPHLGKEHQKLLEGVLEARDLDAIVRVAEILWSRCGSDRGALELIERLKKIPPEDHEPPGIWHAPYVLREIRTEPVARELAALTGAPHPKVRKDALSAAAHLPFPVLAQALIDAMEDKNSTGWTSSYEIRYCDEAAEALIRMAGLQEKFVLKGTDEERDRTIGDLKAWWKASGATVDWAALRKKLDK